MTTIQQDLYFRYHAFNVPSFCHVRVLQGAEETVVICSEPQENSGPSVTNTAGVLTSLLRGHLEQVGVLAPGEPVAWIEHYDLACVYRRQNPDQHSYAQIVPGDSGDVSWVCLGADAADLAERFNYPQECFEIPAQRLRVGVETVLELRIARG